MAWRCRISTRVAAFAGALLLGACVQQQAVSCAGPLRPALEVDLYFGRGNVSDAEWATFLATEVTPRFCEGLSVADVAGQWRDPSGKIGRENSKLLILIVFDPQAHAPKVDAVVAAYKQRFAQQSVLRVEKAVCAAG